MNKITSFISSVQKLKMLLDQNTQPQKLLYTYVTQLINVKIARYHRSVFKVTVKEKVPFWQVFLSEMGY
jgi:hypothetical protein